MRLLRPAKSGTRNDDNGRKALAMTSKIMLIFKAEIQTPAFIQIRRADYFAGNLPAGKAGKMFRDYSLSTESRVLEYC